MNAGWNTGIYFDNLQFSRIFFLHNIKIGKTDPLQFIEHSCTNPHERIMPYGFAITTRPTFKREITHYFQYSLSCQMAPGGSIKHYIIIYTRMIDKMLQGTSTKLPIYHRKLSMDILNGIDLDNSSGSGWNIRFDDSRKADITRSHFDILLRQSRRCRMREPSLSTKFHQFLLIMGLIENREIRNGATNRKTGFEHCFVATQ